MLCPGSIRLTEHLPRSSSAFAAEGTAMHQVAADCLELGLEPEDFIGSSLLTDGHLIEVTQERAGWLENGLAWLRDQPGKIYVEQRVDLGSFMPGQFGTLDVGIVAPDHIVIFDWKFGAGVPVSPVENRQLRIYALGFIEVYAPDLDPGTPVTLVIEQPRVSGGGGMWRTTVGDLLTFREEVREAARATYDRDAPLVPGEKQCRFCPARTTGCAAYDAFNLDLIGAKFDDLTEESELPAVPECGITPERRSIILRHKSMIEQWLERLHADALEDALAGRPVPGMKAVTGRRGSRQWIDVEAADAFLAIRLGDERFTRSLLSPAAAEKAIPRKDRDELATMTVQSAGKPILVPEDDKRPAIEGVDAKFDNLDNGANDGDD